MTPYPQPSEGSTRKSSAELLESWKEIATYLRRDVTTVRRWEKTLGLPVHRLQTERLGGVYAFRGELDAWLERRTQRGSREAAEPPSVLKVDASRPPVRSRRTVWLTLGSCALLAAGAVAWYSLR